VAQVAGFPGLFAYARTRGENLRKSASGATSATRQANPHPESGSLRALVPIEAALRQAERLLAQRLLARPLAPGYVSVEEFPAQHLHLRLQVAPLIDEAAEHVHVLAIGLGRRHDLGRGGEAVLLPIQEPRMAQARMPGNSWRSFSGRPWSRSFGGMVTTKGSNVASLESGRHESVGLETAFALARALEVGLDDLVQGEGDVVLDPKLRIPVDRAEVRRIFQGRKGRKPHYSAEGQQARQTRHDLEADAAQRLGTTVERIRELSDRLYGQPLADQREAQLPKGLDNTVSARRGHRGRVTRRLLAELKAAHEVL
jgi:hypothetical protein